jgi:hypothetical protein
VPLVALVEEVDPELALGASGQNVAFVAGGALLVAWMLGISRLTAELAALTAVEGLRRRRRVAAFRGPCRRRGALASLAWLASRPRDRR